MEGLQSWATAVCLAALAAGMAGIVAPHGSMEKVYKFAVALFFLCCVLTPLFGLKSVRLNPSAAALASSGTSSMADVVNQQKAEQSRQALADLVTRTFQKYGVTPVSVQVSVAADPKGAISVGGVTAVLKKTDFQRADSLRQSVGNELGMSVTIREGET